MKQKIFILLYVWFSLLCLSAGLFHSSNSLQMMQIWYLITVLLWLFPKASAVMLMHRIKTWNQLIREWKGGNRMNFICVCLGIVFIVGGILFALEKGHIHLDAWKKMSRQEKNKIRIRPLCRNIGEIIALNGFLFLLKGTWPGFENRWFVLSMAAWFMIAGFDVWYISKSSRYYKE